MQSSQDTAEMILTLDIGGTFIKSAVFKNGELLQRLPQIPSCSKGSREEIAAAILKAIRQAGKVSRIAVSIPGPFDYKNGIFLAEHKFAAVKDCAFSEFTDGIPASFIHDANAFLLGELLHGAGRGFLRVGGITLGTGLGAAFSIGGDLQLNSMGSPSENVSLWKQPYRDGIAEDYVSARALLKNFPGMDAKELEVMAANGDIQAKHAWEEFSAHLHQLLREWKARLTPDVIILGGQLRKGLFLGEPIPADLNLRFSELGEDAALWGAYEAACGAVLPDEPSESQIRRAIVSIGAPGLYQQFLKRAEQGESLKIGVLGGSITAGASCSVPEKRYHGVLLDYLKKRYPNSLFSLVNCGIGATDSVYGAFRAERDLLVHKPDLVILEFAVNDRDDSLWAASYEGVIRQILAMGCPLILLFMTHNHQRNCQRFQEVIGRHYSLAMVSFHDAIMPELMNGSLRWDDLSPDSVHPNPAAHSFAGKLICALLNQISALPSGPLMVMPQKLISDEFQQTFLLEKDTFCPEENNNWKKIADDDPRGNRFAKRWFASIPGSQMRFSFEGISLWVSYLGIEGPVGRISVQVDNAAPVMIDSYFPHDWQGPKQFWIPVVSSLPQGKHQAVITLLDDHHPEGGTEFYFCAAAGTGVKK
ncbi:MAG: ROK family protein [Victivallales bacterium]|nr:ROK family protein [Victivallales bacterium]